MMANELIIANTIDEALKLKDADSAFLAGGTEVNRKDSPVQAARLILIDRIQGLNKIEPDQSGLWLKLGANVTFQQALEHELVPCWMKEALRFMGSLQKRERASVCGNIAAGRSDSYLLPALIASGARLELKSAGGEQILPVSDLMLNPDGYRESLITSVLIPTEGIKVLNKRYANTVESHAYLTLSMSRSADRYRIGMAIKGSGVYNCDVTNWSVIWNKAEVRDDMYGTESYKRYLTGTTLDDMYEKLEAES